MSEKKNILIVFLLALLIRIIFIFVVEHAPLENDAKEYDMLGFNLSSGKGYVNSEGMPTAFRPPGYPIFLGSIYYIFGHNLLYVRIAQALLSALICVIAHLIFRQLYREKIFNIAGYITCFYAPLIASTLEILSETLFAFILLAGVYLILNCNRGKLLLPSGIVWGAALLTKPIAVFFMPLLYFWLLKRERKAFLKSAAVLSAGIILILLPWSIRNYSKLNAFIPLSNIGGISLYSSYVLPERGFGYALSPESIGEEYQKLQNETERNKYLISKTVNYIAKHPLRTAKLTLLKPLYFFYPFDGYWYPFSFGSKYNIFFGIILIFAFIGILTGISGDNMNLNLVYFLLMAFIIGIIVFEGIPRYRLPIDPFLICLASWGVYWTLKKNIKLFGSVVIFNIAMFFIFRLKFFDSFFYFLKNISG